MKVVHPPGGSRSAGAAFAEHVVTLDPEKTLSEMLGIIDGRLAQDVSRALTRYSAAKRGLDPGESHPELVERAEAFDDLTSLPK